MNFDLFKKDLLEIAKNCNIKKDFTETEISVFVRCLFSNRDTFLNLQSSPRHLLQYIFENSNFYNSSVYCCDIVELRSILKNKVIINNNVCIAFSKSCAERIIKEYKVKLILDNPERVAAANKCDKFIFGGLCCFMTPSLKIDGLLHSIVIESNDLELVNVVDGILKEYKVNCPVYSNSVVPGLDKYKFASKLETFIVHLPAMGIAQEKCRAESEEDALREILAKRWDAFPNRKSYKSKPSRYTVDFWKRSGFFDSIVKKASNVNFLIKNSQTQINLTHTEQQIFQTLLNINQKMNLGLTFRVAGGWVRDKLLGLSSDDIDIALDKMTGKAFVDYAIKYAKENKDSGIVVDSSYIIKQNPEKSKHLETASLNIYGHKIDFVNLRSESYGDSRIPVMELSEDPKVDSERRDLTINSMFYNINNQQVEDYVGGLQDLQNMILKTPLDPKKTFIDDPLRVMRVLRFYSKYPNAQIDSQTLLAMKDPEVRDAYKSKVSPERSGPELLKMLAGERPSSALRVLFSTGLDSAVFDVPETQSLLPLDLDMKSKHHQFNLLEHTLRVVENLEKIMKERNVSKEDRSNMILAALFHDYGKAHPDIRKPKQNEPEYYSYHGHEDKSAEIAEAILKRIGIKESDRKFINAVIKQHMRPHTKEWTNRTIGRFMRDLQVPGIDRNDIWELVMMHAEADSMAKSEEGNPEDVALKQKHFQQMKDYAARPVDVRSKPLVDGNEIMSLFPNLSPKPTKDKPSFIKYIQDKLLEEQMAGNVSDKQQSLNFIESIKQEVNDMYSNKSDNQKQSGWYGSFKKAEFEGLVAGENKNQDDSVKKMIYRGPGDPSMIAIGDKFHSKSVGIAFKVNQEDVYKVISKSNGYVVLQDQNGKKQKVEISVELPAKFIKV